MIIYIIYCSTKPFVFFQSRSNVKVQVYFCPQFYVNVNAELFIHAFMHLCLIRLCLLCGGEKTWVNYFFSNSCGTLIWVRIKPVKVDRSFTGILRTYVIIHASTHLCSVRLWLLGGREKTVESNIFLYFLWYVDMGEDYTIQSQSELNCYNPHLYNYIHNLLFYNTVGFFFNHVQMYKCRCIFLLNSTFT